mgnify:CR=1 FL=1
MSYILSWELDLEKVEPHLLLALEAGAVLSSVHIESDEDTVDVTLPCHLHAPPTYLSPVHE